MAGFDQHLQHAVRNEDSAHFAAEGGDHAWAIALLYYAAFHLVSAYFVQKGLQTPAPEVLEERMLADASLRPALGLFRLLRVYQENALLYCYPFDHEEYHQIRAEVYQPCASHVMQQIRT
jgi:hypothetical protein